MNKRFNLVHTGGPYSDTTSSYSVEVLENANLNDVIAQIVNEHEWGTITIWTCDPKLKECKYLTDEEKSTSIKISYSNRNIEFKNGYDIYLAMDKTVPQLDSHFAKGSYGNMNFTFYMS